MIDVFGCFIYKKRKGFEDRLLPQDLRVQYAHSSKRGPKLENTNLLHSSPPVEFFKLFITKMAEQTNFNVVQRGAIRSFKPASDVVINVYLCINIHTDTGRRPETIFWMFPMEISLYFTLFQAKNSQHLKKNKTRKRLIVN